MYEVEMIGGGRFSAWPMIWRLCPISPQIMGSGLVVGPMADSQICHSAAHSPTLPLASSRLLFGVIGDSAHDHM